MEALTSILFHGLAYAMILYIVSVGLSVTMGLMGFVNLAHGVFAMAGGYVTVTLMNTYAVPFGLALLAAFIVIGADQRGARTHALRSPLWRKRTGAGAVHHRPDLHVGRHRSLPVGPVAAADASARHAQRPARSRLPQLPDVSLLPHRCRLRARSLCSGSASSAPTSVPSFAPRSTIAAWPNRSASTRAACSRSPSLSAPASRHSAAVSGADILAIYPGYATEYLVYFLMVVAIGGLGSLRGPFVAALLLGVRRYRVQVPRAGTRRLLRVRRHDRPVAVAPRRSVRSRLSVTRRRADPPPPPARYRIAALGHRDRRLFLLFRLPVSRQPDPDHDPVRAVAGSGARLRRHRHAWPFRILRRRRLCCRHLCGACLRRTAVRPAGRRGRRPPRSDGRRVSSSCARRASRC